MTATHRTGIVFAFIALVLASVGLASIQTASAACGPYEDLRVTGTREGTVWGSGPYGERSNVGAAAVHAGLIDVGEVALIKRTPVGGRTLTGSTVNGITSVSYAQTMCAYTLSVSRPTNTEGENDSAEEVDLDSDDGSPNTETEQDRSTTLSTIERLLTTIRSLQEQLAQLRNGNSNSVGSTMSTATPGTALAVGMTVRTTSNLNVRATPSSSGELLGTEPAGTQGTITDGPTTANGYTWWKVRYTSGGHGWSVDTYLVKVGSSTTSTTTETARTRSCTLATPVEHGTGIQKYDANQKEWEPCSVQCDAGYEKKISRTFSRSSGSTLQTAVRCIKVVSNTVTEASAITGQIMQISAPDEVYYNTPFEVTVTLKNPGSIDGLTRASIGLTTDPARNATITNNGSVEKVLKAGESAQFILTVRVTSTAGATRAESWTTARFSSFYGPTSKWVYEPISVLRIPYEIYVANCDVYSGNCPANITPGNDDLQGSDPDRKQVYSTAQGKWVYCDENRMELGCACVGEVGKYIDYNPNQAVQLACKVYVGGVRLPYGISTLPNLTPNLDGRGAVMCKDDGSTALVLAQSTCSTP